MFHEPKRFTRILGAVAIGLGLSAGAAGIAAATTGGSASLPSKTTVQQTGGQDQGTGDFTPPGETAEPASQTEPAENANEAPGAETTTVNDGPGGHADPTGAAGVAVDHQFQGNE